jgi:hypothetical protein
MNTRMGNLLRRLRRSDGAVAPDDDVSDCCQGTPVMAVTAIA